MRIETQAIGEAIGLKYFLVDSRANPYNLLIPIYIVFFKFHINVKGLLKNLYLSKSISDVVLSRFQEWLEYSGYKSGWVLLVKYTN